MIVLDLYSGTGSATRAFEKRGHKVVRVELNERLPAEVHRDVTELTAAEVIQFCGGVPDFVWASPPCTAFSVASIGTHWRKVGPVYVPQTEHARDSLRLVERTIQLIRSVGARYWLLENPRGMLRSMDVVKGIARWTVTYCQYGDTRMKPTDLWGVMPSSWQPIPPCRNGSGCHTPAPRGSPTGTQGIKGAMLRGVVPLALSEAVATAVENPMVAHDALCARLYTGSCPECGGLAEIGDDATVGLVEYQYFACGHSFAVSNDIISDEPLP